MSIFDQLRTQGTGKLAVNSMVPFTVEIDSHKTGKIRPHTLDANEQYIVSLTASQAFWANRAQFDHAYGAAVRSLAAHFYSNIHRELSILENAIYSGMAEDAIASISRIRREMTP